MSACVYTHTNKHTGEVFYVGSIGTHPRELRPAMRGVQWGQYFEGGMDADDPAETVGACQRNERFADVINPSRFLG